MNLPAPHLALARSDRFYELGESLRERGPEILQAVQDPANLLPGGAALAGGLAAALIHPIVFVAHRSRGRQRLLQHLAPLWLIQ